MRNNDREMFEAVCDECGETCEVPFKPRGDKPIYCSNCFEKKEGGKPRHSGGRDRRRPSGGGVDLRKIEDRLSHIERKLDLLLEQTDNVQVRFRASKEDMAKLETEDESGEE